MNLKNNILVKKITHKLAAAMIIKHHYSHRMPISTMLNFGIYYLNRLVGVIIFNQGNSPSYHTLFKSSTANKNMELIRLWTQDGLPCGVITRAISVCLKKIKQNNPLLEFIVSFADEGLAHHYGTIYQASNFYYVGCTVGKEKDVYINGKKYHSRGIGATFGVSKKSELEKKYKVEYVIRENKKHKYIYPLNNLIRKELEQMSKPYPKKTLTNANIV